MHFTLIIMVTQMTLKIKNIKKYLKIVLVRLYILLGLLWILKEMGLILSMLGIMMLKFMSRGGRRNCHLLGLARDWYIWNIDQKLTLLPVWRLLGFLIVSCHPWCKINLNLQLLKNQPNWSSPSAKTVLGTTLFHRILH